MMLLHCPIGVESSIPPTMENEATSGEDDGSPGSSAQQRRSAIQVRISSAMNNVMTILYQNNEAGLLDGRVDLSKLNYNSNVGVIIAALLRALGFAWSEAGKKLWRRAEPDGALLEHALGSHSWPLLPTSQDCPSSSRAALPCVLLCLALKALPCLQARSSTGGRRRGVRRAGRSRPSRGLPSCATSWTTLRCSIEGGHSLLMTL